MKAKPKISSKQNIFSISVKAVGVRTGLRAKGVRRSMMQMQHSGSRGNPSLFFGCLAQTV